MSPPTARQRDPRLVLVDAVWDSGGTLQVKGVAHALTRYLSTDWTTTCSIPTLASIAGVNVKTARDVLAALVEAGGVTREDRKTDKGTTSPRWTIDPAALPGAVVAVSEGRRQVREPPSCAAHPVPPLVPGPTAGTPPVPPLVGGRSHRWYPPRSHRWETIRGC